MSLRVVHPGALTLVQDDGRPGLGPQGVGAAGAFDRRALHQARTLVGDAGSSTAALEVLGGGLELRATADHVVAVTGAVGPLLVDGVPVDHGRAVRLHAGQHLTVAAFDHGLRGYVAAAGGFGVAPVLGSRSADTLGRLGPDALAAGHELAVGVPHEIPHLASVPSLLTPGTTSVDVVLGPRDDWFTPAAVGAFLRTGWVVSGRSDRVGVRLEHPSPAGEGLERAVVGELPSEPCVRGSVQVTSAGRPVVLGPDHPVTGGYPVIGVVTGYGVDRLAQVRPGEIVRFRRRTAP